MKEIKKKKIKINIILGLFILNLIISTIVLIVNALNYDYPTAVFIYWGVSLLVTKLFIIIFWGNVYQNINFQLADYKENSLKKLNEHFATMNVKFDWGTFTHYRFFCICPFEVKTFTKVKVSRA
jgi:hypothetical protein